MTSSKITISSALLILFWVVAPASSQQSEPAAGGELFDKMQSDFADAYNRKDLAAIASFFSENAVRITPAGIFRGRDAIVGELKRVIQGLGLHGI